MPRAKASYREEFSDRVTNTVINSLQRVERLRHQAERWPQTPMWSEWHPNPAVRRWHRLFLTYAKEAKEKALSDLFEAVGKLAEKASAHAAGLYLVHRPNRMKAVALHNVDPSNKQCVRFSDRTIVTRVARTGVDEYYQPDVKSVDEHDYREDIASTRSQVTLPIRFNSQLLGILNLESRFLDGFPSLMREKIRDSLGALAKSLLILKSLESKGSEWCPWNPDVHGWDAREPLARLCREAALAISPSSLKFTLWNLDWQKNSLSVETTYGYDWQFQSDMSLRLRDTEIGRAAMASDSTVQTLDVERFAKREKAQSLGIRNAWLIAIRDPSRPNALPVAALTCYASRDAEELDAVSQNDHQLAVEALQEFGGLLTHYLFSVQRQKQALASAVMTEVNAQYADSHPYTQADAWLSAIRQFIPAPAASVFYSEGTQLRCAATTGFLDPKLLIRVGTFINHVYDCSEHSDSHTVTTFGLDGQALRRSRVGDSDESGLPRSGVLRTTQQHAEFIGGCEQFGEGRPENRRFLGCAYRGSNGPAGVVRLVRDEQSHPFSAFDTALLEYLCHHHGLKATGFPPAQKSQSLAVMDNSRSGC